ncbi:insulinase family protein, partial [Escherichia coli]|nr:insulinase family protein [Escherichia coli]
MLDEGTAKRSAEEISNALQSIGASLNTGSNFDSMTVSLQTLSRNLDTALDIFSDVIVNPAFPQKELDSLRARAIAGLRQQRANP